MRAMHPVSPRLAAKAIDVEKRNTKCMTASAKGTVQEPGRNVRQKAGLNRVIPGTGWGGPERMLGYKVGERIDVDAASRTFSECGVVNSASRRSRAEFCGRGGRPCAERGPEGGPQHSPREPGLPLGEALATSATHQMDTEWAIVDQRI